MSLQLAAQRAGEPKIKSDLEDLCFRVLDYDAYREIASLVDMKKEERDRYIAQAIAPIKEELTKFGIKAKVHGRAKHLYSIYEKIRQRGKSFDEILDLLAIRILEDRIEECYFVLGVVHSLYTPLHEKFADHIAMPKVQHVSILAYQGEGAGREDAGGANPHPQDALDRRRGDRGSLAL